jgi:hypothetical protein
MFLNELIEKNPLHPEQSAKSVSHRLGLLGFFGLFREEKKSSSS